jgi:hypothetical protein
VLLGKGWWTRRRRFLLAPVHDEVKQDETGTIQKHLKRIHPSHEIARRYRLQVRAVFAGGEYINLGNISIVDFDDVTRVADG